MWSWSGLLQWLSSADCETLGCWWADNGAGDCRRFRRFDACTVLALHLVSAHLLGFITYICTWAADFSYYSCTIILFTSRFDNRPISSITSPVSLILWMNSTSSVLSYRLCQLFLHCSAVYETTGFHILKVLVTVELEQSDRLFGEAGEWQDHHNNMASDSAKGTEVSGRSTANELLK